MKSDPVAWAIKAFLFLIIVPPFLCVAVSIAMNSIRQFLPILIPAAIGIGIFAGIGRAIATRHRWARTGAGRAGQAHPPRNGNRNRQGNFP